MNDRFFELKILCFVLGAGCGVAGMFTEQHWLVRVGIGFLAVGIILRLIGRRKAAAETEEKNETEDE